MSNHFQTYFFSLPADRMLKGGRGRSRAGSLSSPTHIPAPRLGVSGLYTDHMERRILKGTCRLIFLSRTGTPIQHIEQSVWPVVSLICAKVRSLLLGQLSLMHSA